ncbi:MAG TPA: S53 family peptidase [Candidatus Acidoferrales bacterium]
MFLGNKLRIHTLSIGLSMLAAALTAAPSLQAQQEIQSPKITGSSKDMGLAEPQQQLTLTVHLTPRNEDAYNQAVEALYTPGSPTYHHWFTAADFAKYAPTASDLSVVKSELTGHGLAVVSVDPNNFSVRVRGNVSAVEEAFGTQIHNYQLGTKTFYANAIPAKLSGPAATMVSAVSGLSNFPMKPMFKFQTNPKTGKPMPGHPVANASGNLLTTYFSNDCFKTAQPYTLTTDGASLPVGQYYGNFYGFNDPLKACGYTPQQMQAHYDVRTGINAGLDGTGQTIVLVDGPSDPSVKDDLVAFSQLTGLPPITAKNFQIIYPDGVPSQLTLTEIANWDVEADLDIEWAHAMAPGAKIVLLIAPTQDWTELEFMIQYATQNHLGNVISNSYGYPEQAWGAFTQKGFDQVLQTAAAAGIAVNFSTGDGGDEGLGEPNVGGDSYPSSSAFVTAIGGTSLNIPNTSGTTSEVGWGNNGTFISFATNDVLDPPFNLGLLGGSGGGESILVAKPNWQKNLGIPGANRQQPDISAVADPYTGAIFVSGGFVSVVGGTSLASPVFSAIWALADQKAGVSLGQAAPLIASLPKSSGAVKDIVPVGSPTNLAGTIFDSSGATYYSPDALLAPLYTTTTYFSAAWNLGGGEYVDLSFGTDTSLTVTTGWDNVTGFGVPNGSKFITVVAAAK